MGFFKFRNKIKQFVREQGGMYELYKVFVDLFINDGFQLREVTNDSLYIHYGSENGKIGIQIIQTSIERIEIIIGEELPFNRRNSFKLSTSTYFQTFTIHDKIVSSLQLVKYPSQVELELEIEHLTSSAKDLYHNGNYQKSLLLFKELEELVGESTILTLQKAGCYSHLGENKKALELCLKAKKTDPSNSLIYLNEGSFYLASDNILEAISAFKKGSELGCENCSKAYKETITELFGKFHK